jgi:hypothetical protein
MREFIFYLTVGVGILSSIVLFFDFLPRISAAVRRRRASQGGAWGVVLNAEGGVLGTYLDPFGHRWRAPRIHGTESPWVQALPGDRAWAWEGFGATEEEARDAANRLRRRHLQLLGLLEEPDEGEEGGSFALPRPFAPPLD